MTKEKAISNFNWIDGISKYWKKEFEAAINNNDFDDAVNIANDQANNNNKISEVNKRWLKDLTVENIQE